MRILILLVLFFFGCLSAPKMEPRKLEKEKHCDTEKMKLPENLDSNGWVKVRDVRTIEEANAKCGRHAVEVAQHNYHAAKQNQPDGILDNLIDALKFGSIGFLIGFGAGAGN